MNPIWEFRFATAEEPLAVEAWRNIDWAEDAVDGTLASKDCGVFLAFKHQSDSTQNVGGIRIERRIGLVQPRYWYHTGCVVYAAAELGLFQRERTLLLGNDHTGASELSDLHIDRRMLARSEQALLTHALVSAAMAQLRQDFAQGDAEKVIYAVPGVRDEQNNSPFWEGLGRHFYPGDVDQAQARFGALWLTHVAALLPRHPLIVSLLDPQAQAAIGSADSSASELVGALSASNFRIGQHVSLFDAGPVFEATLAASDACAWQQYELDVAADLVEPKSLLIAPTLGQSIWHIPAQIQDGRILVSRQIAARVGLTQNQTIWQAI